MYMSKNKISEKYIRALTEERLKTLGFLKEKKTKSKKNLDSMSLNTPNQILKAL